MAADMFFTSTTSTPNAILPIQPRKKIILSLLVFWLDCFVTGFGTYLDIHQNLCLAGEPKSGAILGIYFFPGHLPLMNLALKYHLLNIGLVFWG